MLLAEPTDVGHLPVSPPLVASAGLPSERQACAGLEEPVVELDDLPYLDAYAALDAFPPRRLRLRREVGRRLRSAQQRLPTGFDLAILDGFRTLAEQRALVELYGQAGEGGYVAAPETENMRAPHTTGGAVDLTLSWEGRPLGLGTDFDAFTSDAHLHAFEERPGLVRELRRLLAATLVGAGFVGYELEWWHWSYGDDVWAWANGTPAMYDVYDG